MLRIPDWLSYEMAHKLEQFRDRYARLHVKDSINDNAKLVTILAGCSLFVLMVTLWIVLRPPPMRQQDWGRNAWFYDLNTGRLFVGEAKQVGPIEAPSGPLPNGDPAGLRAHVYSYVLDPNESERFVGFLEKPDPRTGRGKHTADLSDFQNWSHNKLIRSVDNEEWVRATGPRGQEILDELTRPNELGQTAVYCVPD